MGTPAVDVQREARTAGIRADDVDLAAVERRRHQLWTVMMLVLFLVSLAAGAWALAPEFAAHAPLSQRFVQLALPLVAATFSAYGFEKERSLRRLTTAVIADQMTREQLSVQSRQLRAALDAGKKLSACLDSDEVVDTLLEGAVSLFDAPDGSLLVVEDGNLRLRATRGDDRGAHLDHDAIEAVAETRVPVRISGDGGEVMLAPLRAEDGCHGVVVLTSRPGGRYDDHDLSVLTAFGDYAAQALVNARRFEDERVEADRLRAAEIARAEFSRLQRDAGVSPV